MANTYTQINIHLVFAVKGRQSLFDSEMRINLYKYITGILNNLDQYPLAVNGFEDHVHVFFEMSKTKSLSEIARTIKSNSSKWINDNKMFSGKFSWQEGYGAFSYSRSQRDGVIKYITNQEQHHRKRTFKEEYLDLLEKFKIEFSNEYVFEFIN